MAKYGYARVSTTEQTVSGQVADLTSKGCAHVFTDTVSGATMDRPGLDGLLTILKAGDEVLVTRLDRLGRSLSELICLVAEIERIGANLRSLTESIDTATPTGRMIFHVFGALAEFERHLIRERTMKGLEAARAKGRVSGRPKAISPAMLDRAKRWMDNGTMTNVEIAGALNVSLSTWRRARAKLTQGGDDDANKTRKKGRKKQ